MRCKFSPLDWHTIKLKWTHSGKSKKAFYDSEFNAFCTNTNKPSLQSFYHYLDRTQLNADEPHQLSLFDAIEDNNSKKENYVSVDCSSSTIVEYPVVVTPTYLPCIASTRSSDLATDTSCINFSNFKITLVTCPIDIRADFAKLAQISSAYLGINLYEKQNLVVFVSKTRQIAKVVGCDASGEIMITKRLLKGRFQQIFSRPDSKPVEELTKEELVKYLKGNNILVKRSNFRLL